MPKTKAKALRNHDEELMEIATLVDEIGQLKVRRAESRKKSNDLSAQIRAKEKDLARAMDTAKSANLFGDGPLAKS